MRHLRVVPFCRGGIDAFRAAIDALPRREGLSAWLGAREAWAERKEGGRVRDPMLACITAPGGEEAQYGEYVAAWEAVGKEVEYL